MPLHEKSKIFFIHIPKTGGSTFEKVIKDHFNAPWSYWGKIHNLERYRQLFPGAEDITRVDPDRNYKDKNTKSFQNVYHHLTFRDIEKTYDIEKLLLEGVKFVSILRNPFDRLVSYFHYGQMRGGLMETSDKTFEEWFYERPISAQSRQFLIDKNNLISKHIPNPIFPHSVSNIANLSPGDNISDRHLRSSEPWALPLLEQTKQKDWNEDVYPTNLELSFTNKCQFRCSYCAPMASSSWFKETKRHGDWPLLEDVNRSQYNISKMSEPGN